MAPSARARILAPAELICRLRPRSHHWPGFPLEVLYIDFVEDIQMILHFSCKLYCFSELLSQILKLQI